MRPQALGEIGTRLASGSGRELSGRPGRHHPPSGVAPARPELDRPVGGGDDVEVVLDHHHRVTAVDQAVELCDQQPRLAPAIPIRSAGGRAPDPRRDLLGRRELIAQLFAPRIGRRGVHRQALVGLGAVVGAVADRVEGLQQIPVSPPG